MIKRQKNRRRETEKRKECLGATERILGVEKETEGR